MDAWEEQDFVRMQKRATSRLHRFYVPQPLGHVPPSAAADPLLEALLPPLPLYSPAPASAALSGSPASPSAPFTPASVVLEGEEARHAARALRLAAGDAVELCDGTGHVVAGTVTGTDKQRVWVSPDGPATFHPWVGARWVVCAACTTLKGGRAEWLAEKVTELGAYCLVPLVTERSQAGGKAKFKTRAGSKASWDSDGEGGGDYAPGRLERVAIAATKQSLRPHALRLAAPKPLQDVLPLVRSLAAGHPAPGGTEYGADGDRAEQDQGQAGVRPRGGGSGFSLVAVAGAPPLATVLGQARKATEHRRSCSAEQAGAEISETCILFVGPEGDFTPGELAALVDAGALPVGLGANRLRTETAAIGLLAACVLGTDRG